MDVLQNENSQKRMFSADYNKITLYFIRWQVLNPGKKVLAPSTKRRKRNINYNQRTKIDIR